MPVTKLTLERFGPFDKTEFPLTPGVNVLLGANSTGKTFAAKALYSVLKGLGPEARPSATMRELLRDKLAGVFRPDDGDVRRLVRRSQGRSTGRVAVALDDGTSVRFTLSRGGRLAVSSLQYESANRGGSGDDDGPLLDAPALFLPSREVLAMFEGFVAAYQSASSRSTRRTTTPRSP